MTNKLPVGLTLLLLSFAPVLGQTPTPAPFTISDAEIKKISREQIVATLKHVLQLYRDALAIIERQKENLANATNSQTSALNATARSLSAITDLQNQITTLAKHDKQMTNDYNAANKKLWWYRWHWWGAWLVFALGVIACGVLAFLKFTGRLAITAGKFGL
jgi:hypothetical protein